jgi:uncharacterized protein YutE (UPF0331/DUF86 family)
LRGIPLKKEVRFRLTRHLDFLENELKDYEKFESLSWEDYNKHRSKRRDVERWVENIVNSSIDIAKIILKQKRKKNKCLNNFS